MGSAIITGVAPASPLWTRLDAHQRDPGVPTSADDHIVHISSALVYGAWPDNPVPLTEEAPLRPNPGIPAALDQAEAERRLGDLPTTVTVLRVATIVGPGFDDRSLDPLARPTSADPVRQFVHVDDVVSAVEVAVDRRLDGVFNVAADGWVPGAVVRQLSARGLVWPRRRRSVRPLLEHPWVIANDKLRATGWEPTYTNEEAIVAGRRGGLWREMTATRRQQVTLALGAGAIVAAVGWAMRRVVARA